MQVTIRPESENDYEAITEVVRNAFAQEEMSDQSEHLLVQKLRKCSAYVPQLALVAVESAAPSAAVVGYIMLTEVHIVPPSPQDSPDTTSTSTSTSQNSQQVALALAPVAVSPSHHKQGIGGALIRHAHEAAKEPGYSSVILLGHQDYYPRFGYRRASEFHIELPQGLKGVPDENWMCVELSEGTLAGVRGTVAYSEPFGI